MHKIMSLPKIVNSVFYIVCILQELKKKKKTLTGKKNPWGVEQRNC